jgi:hypothetical protein
MLGFATGLGCGFCGALVGCGAGVVGTVDCGAAVQVKLVSRDSANIIF